MATLCFEDGSCKEDFHSIVAAIEPLGLRLGRAPLHDDSELRVLLDRPTLSADEKEQVLVSLDRQIGELAGGEYGGCDLVVLHNDVENLDAMLSKFTRCHIHPDDEVRYIVDGEGVFGVVLPDGAQVELTVEAPEYICVPGGIEHWFRLTSFRRIKAVRIFMEGERWEATFTGTKTRLAP